MMKNIFNECGLLVLVASLTIFGCENAPKQENTTVADSIYHTKVYYEEGKYGGWPANWGMWNWGDEILVGFTKADHEDRQGHTFNQASSVTMFSRSKDGGHTWTMEDAFSQGITEATVEHNVGEQSKSATPLDTPIDFTQPDFALTFRMTHMLDGPTSFYFTTDRGKTWNGAYQLQVDFPAPKPVGIVSRTAYLIEGKHEMTAFLTVGFRKADSDWREVACVRTTDGGITWKFLSWIGEHAINSIMPAAVRLGPQKLLALIRRTKPAEMAAFISEDNGLSWTKIADPVKVDANGHPPALLKLKDGRLCLVYGIRHPETMPDGRGMYVVYSSDDGQTWTTPRQIRGGDGSNGDIGYPRSVELPNGQVVATYYYNNAEAGDKYRYIAATIFDPQS